MQKVRLDSGGGRPTEVLETLTLPPTNGLMKPFPLACQRRVEGFRASCLVAAEATATSLILAGDHSPDRRPSSYWNHFPPALLQLLSHSTQQITGNLRLGQVCTALITYAQTPFGDRSNSSCEQMQYLQIYVVSPVIEPTSSISRAICIFQDLRCSVAIATLHANRDRRLRCRTGVT
jgi:hypothetical protein